MIHDATIQFSWDTPAYEYRHKSVDWYWALGIAVIAGAVIAILAHNFLFAFLLVLGGILIAWYSVKQPEMWTVEISKRGIQINKNIFTYADIESFWMYRDLTKGPRLTLKTKRGILPMITVSIPEDTDFTALHTYLLRSIPEVEHHEPVIDRLTDRLGL